MTTDPRAGLLLVMQHADSAFPSGGFAFSQGLEASSLLADRFGGFEFEPYVRTQLIHRWTCADRVALVRSHRMKGDLARIMELDAEVEASTAIDVLRHGSRRNGMAFLTAHRRLGCAPADDYAKLVRAGQASGHLCVVQGLVWHDLGVGEDAAVAISGYQCVASLATAAVRLGLLGALEAQAAIARLHPLVATLSATPIEDDEPLAAFIPLAEIAVLMPDASGQRLFSS
ncbi:urease accessory protein UreF [Aliihoeflea sp. 40Bstr573]|uniref:urease accessory protein UreF n=1 Tax=Aliihoeflea sp. 40Bstr573 TaxID=2696467 RepID=UPI0020944F22|nr:urease accessory UreF family protein [Aliihoeflea sp. 40Bstr573]MCO6387794.1 urease accessory protein UreF [Aliihoeflea sp. 40Bstr573]